MIGDEAVAWYFMGEGSLQLAFHKDKQVVLGLRAEPIFTFTSNEIALLEPIIDWLNAKKIPNWTVKKPPRNQNQRLGYFVSSRHFESVYRFVNAMMPYLVGRKLRQAEIMLEVIKKYRRNSGESFHNAELEKKRLLELCKYRKALRDLSALKGKVKYTEEYLRNIWNMN